MPWPYARDEILFSPSPHRPVMQGDLFTDIPVVKARAGDQPPISEPKLASDRRRVMLLGYPCDIYDYGRLVRVQTVAVVREATKIGIPEDWGGGYVGCPLPDPFGDGQLWAADFMAISPVDRAYLVRDQRAAALTELGLAYLRSRLALYQTRLKIPLAPILEAGRPMAEEVDLWERWIEIGQDESAFAAWLDAFDVELGTTRREAMEGGRSLEVGQRMAVQT